MANLTLKGLALFAAALACSAGLAAPTPTLTTASVTLTVVGLVPGVKPTGALVLTVDGVEATVADSEVKLSGVLDLKTTTSANTTVDFSEPIASPANKTQRRWVLPFSVTGMAAGQTMPRYVTFKLGQEVWALPYQLTSAVATPVKETTWSLKLPPATSRALSPTELQAGLPIHIAVTGNAGISGVGLGPTELRDPLTQQILLDGKWVLKKASVASEPLAAGAHQFLLQPASGATIRPGKYEGTVTVVSNDKPSGENGTLTIYVSNWCWRLFGIGMIFAGALLSLWFTQFLRFRVNRDELRVPAVLVRDRATRLGNLLDGLKIPVDLIQVVLDRLQQVRTALAEQRLLDNGLPRMSSPFTANSPTAIEGYKAYIQKSAAWVQALDEIISTGIVPLDAKRIANNDAVDDADFKTAIGKVVALATSVGAPPTSTAIATAVLNAFDVYHQQRQRGLQTAAATQASSGITADQLFVRIARANYLGWAVLILVTTLAGTQIIVLQNAGFGTPIDLMFCLLWGLGLPSGTALAGFTTGSISTTFNIGR